MGLLAGLRSELNVPSCGIDGRVYFNDSADASDTKEALISVKGGGVTVSQVRDLRGTVERDEAALGVLICIEPPTKPMLKEAADAGFYTSPAGTRHPRLQVQRFFDRLPDSQPSPAFVRRRIAVAGLRDLLE